MVFEYFGKVEKLAREVESVKDVVNKRYLELLGAENYDRLQRTVKRVLIPESFFDSQQEYIRVTKERRDFPTAEHLFGMMWLDPSKNKPNTYNVVITTGFFLSEEVLKEGAKYYNDPSCGDSFLPTYIHEFDHFVLTTLQRPSIAVIRKLITKKPFNHPEDLETLAEELESQSFCKERKSSMIQKAIVDYLLKEMNELGTRFLDSQVLRPLGLQTNWRNHCPPVFGNIEIAGIDTNFRYQKDGNPFYQLKSSEILPYLLEWQKHFRPPFTERNVDTLLKYASEVRTEIVSYPEYLRRELKNEKREQ